MHHELIERMNDMELQKEAGRLLDLEDLRPGNGNRRWGEPVVQLLSKPPYGPPLYWHQVSSGPQPCFSPAAEPTRSQDWMGWNNPLSTTPWPQVIFFS